MMIAPGNARRPHLRPALGAGAQVVAVQFVEAGAGEPQFLSGGGRGKFLAAMAGEEVTDDGGGQAFDQL